MLIEHLHSKQPITQPFIKSLPVGYRKKLAKKCLDILNNNLVNYQPIATSLTYICKVVVSSSPHHGIFSILHTSPTTGHMG